MDSQVKPFVDFYSRNGISPVAQDISDLRVHFNRREALYRHLRVPPALVEGRDVIEFGPGSGYNALYTAGLKPGRYVLVDGNATGLERAQALLQPYWKPSFALVEALIEDYTDENRYDVVICEGVIPFQLDPISFTRTIAKFAKPGGLVIITTIDAVSFLSEVIRRLASGIKTEGYRASVQERLSVLRPFFAPHLQTLAGRSRPVDDWILDNVLNPFVGGLFSIDDAITALDGEFDVLGTSPDFMTDWRWYKDAGRALHAANEMARTSYFENVSTFADYRFVRTPHSADRGRAALAAAGSLYSFMQRIEAADDVAAIPQAAVLLEEIGAALDLEKSTRDALDEASRFLKANGSTPLDAFAGWFGRGQQYMSFIRSEAGS